jgi:hypothetical protein
MAGIARPVSATTVAKILREGGAAPASARAQLGWREFLRTHAASMIACDFFTVETLWLGRLYVLFFMELGTRRVHLAGCSTNPDRGWTTEQARQLATAAPMDRDQRAAPKESRQALNMTGSSSPERCTTTTGTTMATETAASRTLRAKAHRPKAATGTAVRARSAADDGWVTAATRANASE